MISFIEACSQQQAYPGNFALVRYFRSSFFAVLFGRFSAILGMAPAAFFDCNGLWRGPVPCPLWGEERVKLDNEAGNIVFQLYFLNVEPIFFFC